MSDDCNIKVICRFRPINNREKQEAIAAKEDPDKIIVKFIGEQTCEIIQSIQGNQRFVFDRVFDMQAKQPDVYDATARKTIEDVVNGFNGTIFAYGQTGAGKSFSMFGGDDPSNEVTRGIIPRATSHIFSHIMNDKSETEYTIKVSFLEIYNEKIRDLLNTAKDNLQVRQSPARGIYVDGATEEFVSSEENIYNLMRRGEENRTVQATLMNAVSSRSHSIFIVMVQQKDPEGSTKMGKLNLVDLAGSEKIAKTGAQGSTLEEAKNINKSLSALGNCIHALTEKSIRHIPYRDSKLTRMLQESLGGNCKTTLLIACSPHPFNVDETISTCKFGQRAKSIKNRVKQNAQKSVAELMSIITKLQQQLAMWKSYSQKLEEALAWYKENHTGETCPIDIPTKPTLASLMSPKKSSGSAENSEKGNEGGSRRDRKSSLSERTDLSDERSRSQDMYNEKPKYCSIVEKSSSSIDVKSTKNLSKSLVYNKVPVRSRKSKSRPSSNSDDSSDEGNIFQYDETMNDPMIMLASLETQLETAEKAKKMLKDSYEDEIGDMKQTIREQYQDIICLKEKLQELGVDTSAFSNRTINTSWLESDDEITRAIKNSAARDNDTNSSCFGGVNAQWEEERTLMEEELNNLATQLDETKATNMELEAKVKDKEALEKQIIELEEVATIAVNDKEELEKELEEKVVEIKSIQEDYEDQIEILTNENNDMQQIVVTLDDELKQVKAELEEKELEIKEKNSELEENKELASLLEKQISKYDADIVELRNNYEIMRESRDEALKNRGELRETMQKVDSLQAELSHERTKADQLSIKNASMERIIETLKEEIMSLTTTQEQQKKELREKDLDIKKYAQTIEMEQSRNDMLQSKIDCATSNITTIKEELAQKTNLEKELRIKYEKLVVEVKNITESKQKIFSLEEQLKCSENEKKELLESNKKVVSEAEAKIKEVVLLKAKQNTGSERIHALNTQIKTLKSDICKCNDKIRNYERQIFLMQNMFEEEKKEIIAKYTNNSGARITYNITPSALRSQAKQKTGE